MTTTIRRTRCTSPPRRHTRACRPDCRPLPGTPDGLCPVCGLDVIYSLGWDRYFHTDGTDNRACWVYISHGLPPNFEVA